MQFISALRVATDPSAPPDSGLAREHGAALIVPWLRRADIAGIGARGATGWRHVLFGVVGHVPRQARCVVRALPPGGREFQLP